MRRPEFLTAAAVGAAGLPTILRASNRPILRIGIVADPQYADIDTLNTRFYRQSIGKLTEAVEYFDQQELAWCANLGDTIDKKWEIFDEILKPIRRSKHRFYHVLGNHDFDIADQQKSLVPDKLDLRQRYYSIEHEGWSFLFLDTTDISLYAQPVKSAENDFAKSEYEKYKSAGTKGAKTWNGAVSERQLQWFEAQCQAAAQSGRRVIVFAHHPIFPDADHNEWNAARIREVIQRNANVVAWFNGHNHAGAFGVFEDVPFTTIHGMVETENSNAYALLEIFSDRLVLTGHGREPSRELKLR